MRNGNRKRVQKVYLSYKNFRHNNSHILTSFDFIRVRESVWWALDFDSSAHSYVPKTRTSEGKFYVEKVLDGRIAVVCIQPPLINLQPRGRPVGVRNLPKKSKKRDASLFEHMEDRSGERRCWYVKLLGTADVSVPRLIVNVNYINTAFHIDQILLFRCEQWCYMYSSSPVTLDSTKYNTLPTRLVKKRIFYIHLRSCMERMCVRIVGFTLLICNAFCY